MKNNRNRYNISNTESKKKKIKYLAISSLFVVGGLGGSAFYFLKDKNETISQEEILPNIESNLITTDADFVDIKDFADGNTLNDENLNKFNNIQKTALDNFIFIKRDTSFKKSDIYVTNKNRELLRKISIESDEEKQMEIYSAIELSDNSLLLKISTYSLEEDGICFSLQKFTPDGKLDFSKNIDNDIDILNLYSSKDYNGYATLETNLDGKVYLCNYKSNGELVFKYNLEYDYTSNIDVILKEDKTIVTSASDTYNIIELDNKGSVIRTINIPFENITLSKITDTSDNGYIVNFVKIVSDSINDTESHYVKFDSKGEIEWSTLEKAHSFAKSIFEVDDGYMTFNYEYKEKENANDNANADNNSDSEVLDILNIYSVVKLDKKGDIVWKKELGVVDDSASGLIFSISGEYYQNGYLVVNGVLEDSKNNKCYIRVFVDKEGYISNVGLDENAKIVG